MALAVHTLGHDRRAWALAMQVEFEAARADGKDLTFAIGCWIAACREFPRHKAGRFTIANHFVALAVMLPIAALITSTVLMGFPSSYLTRFGALGLLDSTVDQRPLLSEANRSAVPSLFVLVLAIAALNLRMAWLALERDWTRLMAVGALNGGTTAALLIFSTVVFADHAAALAQAVMLTVELTAATVLARWHTRLVAGRERQRSH